jgi:diguanylate cyclase (GGDEF)-like protein
MHAPREKPVFVSEVARFAPGAPIANRAGMRAIGFARQRAALSEGRSSAHHSARHRGATWRLRVAELQARVARLAAENARLSALAYEDPLTGLANRRGFEVELDRALGSARRYRGSISLLMIDLDGMKQVNDRWGHPVGDEALRRVADVLRASLRSNDLAARLGGDEFAVVLPATSAEGAERVARRIRSRIASLSLPHGVRLSASVGMAVLDGEGAASAGGSALVARADAALYAAKRGGKNRVGLEARGY